MSDNPINMGPSENFFLFDLQNKEFITLRDGFSCGRQKGDLVFSNDKMMSKEHCRFNIKDGQVTVTDLSSSNGTRVNGNNILTQQLSHNDSIKIGNHEFIFSLYDDVNQLSFLGNHQVPPLVKMKFLRTGNIVWLVLAIFFAGMTSDEHRLRNMYDDLVDFGQMAATISDFLLVFLGAFFAIFGKWFFLERQGRSRGTTPFRWLSSFTLFLIILFYSEIGSVELLRCIPAGYYGWQETMGHRGRYIQKLPFNEALVRLEQAQRINMTFGENKNRTAEYLFRKGRLLKKNGHIEESAKLIEQAYTLYAQQLSPNHPKLLMFEKTCNSGVIRSCYKVGALAREDGDLAEANLFHKKACDGGNILGCYDLACLYSIQGDAANALEYLDRSLKLGYKDFGHMRWDKDLDHIRGLPKFKEIVDAAKKKVVETRGSL